MGAGVEDALDRLDYGGAVHTPYRHLVTAAIADHFMASGPPGGSYRWRAKRQLIQCDTMPAISGPVYSCPTEPMNLDLTSRVGLSTTVRTAYPD